MVSASLILPSFVFVFSFPSMLAARCSFVVLPRSPFLSGANRNRRESARRTRTARVSWRLYYYY
eukprot:3505749-Pyramimonas_sp.AAC.1